MAERKKPSASAKAPQPESGLLGAPGDFRQVEDRIGGKITGWLEMRTNQIDQKVDLKMEGLEKQLLAKLDATDAKLDNKPNHGTLLTHTIATIGIILTVLLAVLAIGGSALSGGMSATGAFADQLTQRSQHDAETARQIQEMRSELRAIRGDLQNASMAQGPPSGNAQ